MISWKQEAGSGKLPAASFQLPAVRDEDGYSFIRRVRAHSTPAIQTVPAIAVTAYAGIPDREEALAVGFQQHLAKPIDPGRLVQAIHDLTRRSA